MPILPEGSILTFTNTSPSLVANVVITDCSYTFDQLPFTRVEFMHKRLLDAPNVDGSKPAIFYTDGGVPNQHMSSCNPNDTARPLTPDDANLDQIYRRFDIKRYHIVGAMSLDSEIAKLKQIAQAHKLLLGAFEDHQNKARSADVSYTDLVTVFQAVTNFSYLTTTGLQMSGLCLGVDNPENNMLIVDFSPSVESEDPQNAAASTSNVDRSFTMVIENRVEVAASSATW